jgi:hypothetical protein
VAPRGETGKVSRALFLDKAQEIPCASQRRRGVLPQQIDEDRPCHGEALGVCVRARRLAGRHPDMFQLEYDADAAAAGFAEQEGMCARCRGEQPRP